MAYADRRSAPNRGPIFLAIGLLHAGVIYALVTGLAGYVPVLNSESRTTATHMPLPKPPPDQPDTKRDPQAPARDARTDAMETVFTTTNVELGGRTEVEVDLGGGSDDIFVLPDPSPTATDPVIPPRLARPIGKPSQWVTVNDYPTAELSAGHEGITRFRLSIGTDGKVQSCEITESSGFPRLDQAACANLKKRARFVAATGAGGAPTPGTYTSAVRWEIPVN